MAGLTSIQDPTTLGNTLTVNSNGSINVGASVLDDTVSTTTPQAVAFRAATTEGNAGANVVLIAQGLVNPAGRIDRMRTDGGGRVLTNDVDYLRLILVELRTLTAVITAGLNVQDDPDSYRNDPAFDPADLVN